MVIFLVFFLNLKCSLIGFFSARINDEKENVNLFED